MKIALLCVLLLSVVVAGHAKAPLDPVEVADMPGGAVIDDGVPEEYQNLAADLQLEEIVDVPEFTKEEVEAARKAKQEKLRGKHPGFQESLDRDVTEIMNRGLEAVEEGRKGNRAPIDTLLQLGAITDTDPRSKCSSWSDRPCDDPNHRNTYQPGQNQYKLYMRVHLVKKRSGGIWIENVKEEINRETYIKNIGLMIADGNDHVKSAGITIKAKIYLWSSDNFSSYGVGEVNGPGCLNFRSYMHNLKKFGGAHFDDTMFNCVANNYCSDMATTAGFAYYPWTGYAGWSSMKLDKIDAISSTFPHELGHNLGLKHSFVGTAGGSSGNEERKVCEPCYEASGSAYRGDLCEDTAPHYRNPDIGGSLFCNVADKKHCVECSADYVCSKWGTTGGKDVGKNLMSYNTSYCRTVFTTCQQRRMLCYGAEGSRVKNAFRKQCNKTVTEAYRCCKKKVMWWCQSYGTCHRTKQGWGDC